MLKPIYTEKSLKLAKNGKYSFWVESGARKDSLKSELAKIYKVSVVSVRTLRVGAESGRNIRGRAFYKQAYKKAIFTLKPGEKLDIFEETKK